MANIKILAGDFLQGDGEYFAGTITLVTPLFPWPGISFKHNDIKSVEMASQASSKKKNRRRYRLRSRGRAGARACRRGSRRHAGRRGKGNNVSDHVQGRQKNTRSRRRQDLSKAVAAYRYTRSRQASLKPWGRELNDSSDRPLFNYA